MFRKRTKSAKRRCWKLDEIVLPSAKLRFCPEQLLNLNFIFQKKLQQNPDKSLLLAKSVTERLVQRLVCGAGMLDTRFSSKFLISNKQNTSSRKLEYFLRLDCLSTPKLYESDAICKCTITETNPDYPAAYARFKVQSSEWEDCTNPQGFLRRDKVQAKLVELLAQAAANDIPNSPLSIDESTLCGIPGKIVSAFTLSHILKVASHEHFFYGVGGNVPRFPDPRDFRLAIVDEPNGIRLRVEFLSPALANITINVRILVVIGMNFWPQSTDFPARVPLGHSDCLLYHQAAKTGMYLVGYGVQSSAWQIRVPAAEAVLMDHYNPNSTTRTVLDVLYDILEEIGLNRSRNKHSYQILNRYIFLTILLQNLEDNSSSPSEDLINWSPLYLSTIVLKLLDQIITALLNQKLSNYFFKKSNLMVNPGHLCEDDYEAEANIVKFLLLKLFDESLMSTKGNEEFTKILTAQETETVLLYKWRELIDGLLPPAGTRGRRFCFAGSRTDIACNEYTNRQLEYIGLLLECVLEVKQNILQGEFPEQSFKEDTQDSHLEDVVYILVSIMDQARDQYLQSQTNPDIVKNKSKIKQQFTCCTSKLVETIRKDGECQNLEDDSVLVKIILKYLYQVMDQNKKYLAPILRPYLNQLFTTSHAVSWHLDFIKQRLNNDELTALGAFAKLVNNSEITPAQGLIDAVNKNWIWAKNMLNSVEKNTLRVVFIAEKGRVTRHILSLPSYDKKEVSGSKSLKEGQKDKVEELKTLPRNYFSTILTQNRQKYTNITPQHDLLRDSSPLTIIIGGFNRQGEHRGYGDILKSLLSMQKLNMFQQVTSNLPHEERAEIFDLIQSMQALRPKKSTKRWSQTLPVTHYRNKIIVPKNEPVQKYTPTEETELTTLNLQDETFGSLIRSCRTARIREDNSILCLQDNFRIRSFLNN